MLAVPNEQPRSTNAKARSLSRTGYIILIALLALLAIGTVGYKMVKSKEAPIYKISTDYQPDSQKSVSVGLTDIIIDTRWTLLSGHHATVTFRGSAQSKTQKIKYVCLAYRALNDNEWIPVDAIHKKGTRYEVKLRDLHENTVYACYFVAVTNEGKYASKMARFETPKR